LITGAIARTQKTPQRTVSSRRAISIAGRRGQLDELEEGYSALQRIYARLARVAVPELPFKPAPRTRR